MKNTNTSEYKNIKNIIKDKVYVSNKDEQIGLHSNEDAWIFDFRRILMQAEILEDIAELFWQKFKDKYPFQICSLEVAGIPLSMGLMMHLYYKENKKDAESFFIRKSRKKNGLTKMIEGTINPDKKIILVDDIMNSGKTFIRQIEVLEELGYKIDTVFVILRFRNEGFYQYFHDRNIKVVSLFELDDFNGLIGKDLKNLKSTIPNNHMPFEAIWKFTSPSPNFYYVVQKSNPIIDEENIYFGSDSGYFWSIKQKDGSVNWKFKVGFHPKGKSIFSTPVLYKNLVIFGSYDGNLYALDKNTGKKKWIFFEADYIGSSPVLSEKDESIFIGLEFGLVRKKGGIACIDANTGKTKWFDTHPSFTHSTPFYIEKTNEVCIGSNDGIVRMYNAKNGKKKWEYKVGDASEQEILSGFSEYDIKQSFAYYDKKDYLIFGASSPYIFIINRKNGKEVYKHKLAFGSYSNPLVYENKVYFASLDKNLYCINLDTLKEEWKWMAGARIFASPVCINEKIYIGSNTGRLSELNRETGKEEGFITIPERITGRICYNEKTKKYFLPTFANEVYCLEREEYNPTEPVKIEKNKNWDNTLKEKLK